MLQGVTSIGLFKDKLPETLKHFFFLVSFLEIDELAWIKNFQNRNQPDEKNEVWRMSSDGSYLVKLKVVNGQPWVTDNTVSYCLLKLLSVLVGFVVRAVCDLAFRSKSQSPWD